MASSERPAKSYSRRFAWLAIAIVAVIGLYTAGWFYVASLLEAEAGEAIARVERDGGVALCANRETRGYPFRIGLFCDRIGVTDAEGKVEIRGEGLRTAAQIYDPFRIVGELDTLRIGYPGRQPGVSASASDMRFSASVAQPLPERASVTLREISVDAEAAGNDLPVSLKAATGEAHMRRNAGDLDVAMQAQDVSITPPGMDGAVLLPLVSLDLTVEDGVERIARRTQSLRGTSIVLRSVTVSLGEDAGVTISGPVAVDSQGLVDASLQITVNKPAVVAARLGAALPAQKDTIQSAMSGFAMLGDSPSLPLSVEKGVARIGFITLGRVPALK